MKIAVKILAIMVVLSQGLLPASILIESYVRGLDVPFYTISLCLLMQVISLFLKGRDGKSIFRAERMQKFGWYGYYTFDVLEDV